MVISQHDAGAALRDVELIETRTRQAGAYRVAAPQLLLWGGVWIVGYGLMGVLPIRDFGPLWAVLDLVGIGGSLALRRTAGGPRPASKRGAILVPFVAIFAFILATYAVMKPTSLAPYLTYPALVMALVYALVGAWLLPRYLWIAVAIFALTLIGYALVPVAWLSFWIAGVGGGGLILGGAWLRRA